MRFTGIPASKASLAVVFAAFTFGMLAGTDPRRRHHLRDLATQEELAQADRAMKDLAQ